MEQMGGESGGFIKGIIRENDGILYYGETHYDAQYQILKEVLLFPVVSFGGFSFFSLD